MKIRRFIEKPQGRMQSNYVFAGGFVLQPRIFDLLRQRGQSIEACYQYLFQVRACRQISGKCLD